MHVLLEALLQVIFVKLPRSLFLLKWTVLLLQRKSLCHDQRICVNLVNQLRRFHRLATEICALWLVMFLGAALVHNVIVPIPFGTRALSDIILLLCVVRSDSSLSLTENSSLSLT